MASPTPPTPPATPVTEDLVGPPRAAQFLDTREDTLRTWVHRRQVPFVRIGPRSVRFRLSELARWANERSVPARGAK